MTTMTTQRDDGKRALNLRKPRGSVADMHGLAFGNGALRIYVHGYLLGASPKPSGRKKYWTMHNRNKCFRDLVATQSNCNEFRKRKIARRS
jgi:hypothetical protein